MIPGIIAHHSTMGALLQFGRPATDNVYDYDDKAVRPKNGYTFVHPVYFQT